MLYKKYYIYREVHRRRRRDLDFGFFVEAFDFTLLVAMSITYMVPGYGVTVHRYIRCVLSLVSNGTASAVELYEDCSLYLRSGPCCDR